MKTVETLNELWKARKDLPGPVGLVPTMGFLHDGHLTLVKEAKQSCASVVVSIFVNPTQFGPSEDLDAYPRDLQRDLSLLEALDVDLVWIPTSEVMYPANYQTWVEVSDVTKPLEGSYRPGHFRGVTTVVSKLFNAVQPDVAVFGQKDAQQVAVISQMTRDLSYPIEIKVVPIVRESDGLALSSRNTYLNQDQRKAATVLYRALRAAEKAYLSGERSAENIRQIMSETIADEPLASAQYVSCADLLTLTELETITNGALLSMAVYVGKTRLIDNWILGKPNAD
ncbi:MAG: pantoate--beta-alanine ligase [Anaerolineales bacterium]|jgi:pantoate--beta-alanine ligase